MRLTLSLLRAIVACLFLGNSATGQDKETAGKRDLEKLQGEWKLVRCETDGSKLDIGAAKLVIKEHSYVLRMRPGSGEGTVSLDPFAKPKEWDLREKGSDETFRAVYELNGNRLRFAYRLDNNRPKSVFGTRGSDEGHVLYVFERRDGKPETADDQPKKEIPRIVVAADKTPFQKELKLAQTGTWNVVLPNGKAVTLWVSKDRWGLGQTKSGLYCEWEDEDHIQQGPVIYRDKTIEHELFVEGWKLSYINDLESSPHLNVTVLVTKREKK